MTRVIGVRFRTAGKIYFFDPLDFEIKRGDHVIVETARGIEFGTVMSGITEVEDDKIVQPLKPVIRIANQRDLEQTAGNRAKEKEAFRICQEKISKHELDMKLIDVEYTFDNNKIMFYFTADGRIDFRELVKDLAAVFKTRIELRQIGVRDETKIVGGIGICGRALCCHSYLSDFIPVSIKMAKEQNLSLNPTKISGVCGRLMCCLKNEEETYEELNRRLPGIGDRVTTEEGLRGEVQSVNVLRQLVKVLVEDGDSKELKEYPVEKLQFRRRRSKKEKMELSREELKELEKLEEEEKQEKESEEAREEGQRQAGRGRRQEGEQHRERGSRHENGGRQEGRNRRDEDEINGPGGDQDDRNYRQDDEQRRDRWNRRQDGRNRRRDENGGLGQGDYREVGGDRAENEQGGRGRRRQNGDQYRENRDHENRDRGSRREEEGREDGNSRQANALSGGERNQQEGEQRQRRRRRNRNNRQRPDAQEGQTKRDDNQPEG